MLGGEIAAALVVGIDREEAFCQQIDERHRLAGFAEHVEQFRLEKAGAEQGIRIMEAQLVSDRIHRSHGEEGGDDALGAAGFLDPVQHGREEGRVGQRVVLAMQQEGELADLSAAWSLPES